MPSTKNIAAPLTGSLMMTARGVAEMLNISERHAWELDKKEQLPRPVRFGRSVRWYRKELVAWVDAGVPCRAEWEKVKSASRGGRNDS